MAVFVFIVSLSFIGFFIHLFLTKEPKTKLRVVELLLLYQLIFSVGAASLLSFFGLTLMPEYVAIYSGWHYSQFEQLLANVNLGFSALGFMCIWFRDKFWTATVVGSSIWLFGDGVYHFIEAIQNNNWAEGNIGIVLYADLILPLIATTLLILYHRYQKQARLASREEKSASRV